MARKFHPFCRICGWRKGGVDSWDGAACKCGLYESPLGTCPTCGGLGTVPYDIGQQPCPNAACGGSGLVPA